MVLFSIVIPCLNEENNIEETLNSCIGQSIQAHEIIVVDGHSTDKTLQIISNFKEVKLFKSKPHVGLQRRLGATNANGDYIIFLDADTILPTYFISKLMNLLNYVHFGVICPWYFPKQNNLLIHAIFLLFNLIFRLLWLLAPSGAGSCMVVNRKKYLYMPEKICKLRYDDIATVRYLARRSLSWYSLLPVYVSERRFNEQGILKTFVKYLGLSFFFFFGSFKFAEIVPYSFSHKDEKI